MWTKEKVEKFIVNYGFSPKETKREIKELPNILYADEELHGLLEGDLKRKLGNLGHSAGHNGLVIATNKRIIFFHKSSFLGVISRYEMPLYMITSCEYGDGFLSSGIAIFTANQQAAVDWCVKEEAKRFHKIVNELLTGQHTSAKKNTQHQQVISSNLEQLEKLFELKQKEIITEDEFKQHKAKLLNTESANNPQFQQAEPNKNEIECNVQLPKNSELSFHSNQGQKGGNKGCIKFLLIIFAIILIGVLTSKEEVQTDISNDYTKADTTKEENMNTLNRDSKIDTTVIPEKKWELKIVNGRWVIDSTQYD